MHSKRNAGEVWIVILANYERKMKIYNRLTEKTRRIRSMYNYFAKRLHAKNKKEFLKEMSIREFSERASDYDSPDKYQSVKDDYANVASFVNKEKFNTLVDCGCGTGNFVNILSDMGLGKDLIGVDISPEMVKVAEGKKIKNARFIVGDSENMGMPKECADVVTCIHSFHHYPNPDAFFQSVKYILVRGGRLIIRDNACPNALSYWIRNHIIIPFSLNLFHNQGDVHFYSMEEMKIFAERHGFEIEELSMINSDTLHCVMRKVSE